MKKFIVAIAIFAAPALLAVPAAHAQQEVSTMPAADRTSVSDSEIDMMRKDIRSRRKQIIAANVQMTDAEAEKFWPIYDQYAADQKKAYDIHYSLLKEYAAADKNMTDALALSLTKRWTEADTAKAQLRVKYFPMFDKVLGAKRAARICQLDRMLTLMVDLQIGSDVPLINP
ncbi:MAG TPA: hypothetical protein VE961_06635 [Pyrinomonadaceae bacterium]|nr:hypothetical protein [Pyrinomonadaceae bacterium]